MCSLNRRRFVFELVRSRRDIWFAKSLFYQFARLFNRLISHADGIRPHVGDKSNHVAILKLNTLVKLLCDAHSLSGRVTEFVRSVLLHGGSFKRWGRRDVLFAFVKAYDLENTVLCHLLKFSGLFLVFYLVRQLSFEDDAVLLEINKELPVFLRFERLNLFLALYKKPQGHGLNPACGQPLPNALPQQRAYLVSDKSVEYAASDLRLDLAHVDLLRLFNGLFDGILRYLVEQDALDVILTDFFYLLCHMICDGFTFTVRVAADINLRRLNGTLLQLF